MAAARLSPAKRRALNALDRHVLRQYEDLYRRDGVRWRTLTSLLVPQPGQPALVRRVDLTHPCWLKAPYHSFFQLTDAGVAARRKRSR